MWRWNHPTRLWAVLRKIESYSMSPLGCVSSLETGDNDTAAGDNGVKDSWFDNSAGPTLTMPGCRVALTRRRSKITARQGQCLFFIHGTHSFPSYRCLAFFFAS